MYENVNMNLSDHTQEKDNLYLNVQYNIGRLDTMVIVQDKSQ